MDAAKTFNSYSQSMETVNFFSLIPGSELKNSGQNIAGGPNTNLALHNAVQRDDQQKKKFCNNDDPAPSTDDACRRTLNIPTDQECKLSIHSPGVDVTSDTVSVSDDINAVGHDVTKSADTAGEFEQGLRCKYVPNNEVNKLATPTKSQNPISPNDEEGGRNEPSCVTGTSNPCGDSTLEENLGTKDKIDNGSKTKIYESPAKDEHTVAGEKSNNNNCMVSSNLLLPLNLCVSTKDNSPDSRVPLPVVKVLPQMQKPLREVDVNRLQKKGVEDTSPPPLVGPGTQSVDREGEVPLPTVPALVPFDRSNNPVRHVPDISDIPDNLNCNNNNIVFFKGGSSSPLSCIDRSQNKRCFDFETSVEPEIKRFHANDSGEVFAGFLNFSNTNYEADGSNLNLNEHVQSTPDLRSSELQVLIQEFRQLEQLAAEKEREREKACNLKRMKEEEMIRHMRERLNRIAPMKKHTENEDLQDCTVSQANNFSYRTPSPSAKAQLDTDGGQADDCIILCDVRPHSETAKKSIAGSSEINLSIKRLRSSVPPKAHSCPLVDSAWSLMDMPPVKRPAAWMSNCPYVQRFVCPETLQSNNRVSCMTKPQPAHVQEPFQSSAARLIQLETSQFTSGNVAEQKPYTSPKKDSETRRKSAISFASTPPTLPSKQLDTAIPDSAIRPLMKTRSVDNVHKTPANVPPDHVGTRSGIKTNPLPHMTVPLKHRPIAKSDLSSSEEQQKVVEYVDLRKSPEHIVSRVAVPTGMCAKPMTGRGTSSLVATNQPAVHLDYFRQGLSHGQVQPGECSPNNKQDKPVSNMNVPNTQRPNSSIEQTASRTYPRSDCVTQFMVQPKMHCGETYQRGQNMLRGPSIISPIQYPPPLVNVPSRPRLGYVLPFPRSQVNPGSNVQTRGFLCPRTDMRFQHQRQQFEPEQNHFTPSGLYRHASNHPGLARFPTKHPHPEQLNVREPTVEDVGASGSGSAFQVSVPYERQPQHQFHQTVVRPIGDRSANKHYQVQHFTTNPQQQPRPENGVNAFPRQPNKSSHGYSCAECKRRASMICSRCESVRYCSKECQIKHWYQHGLVCTP